MANWLLPANPKYYDINGAFKTLGSIDWNQVPSLNKIEPGDIAYIYQGTPIQKICWKCLVTEVDKTFVTINDSMFYRPPLDESDEGVSGKWITLKAVYQYPDTDIAAWKTLKEHGMNFPPQGPRHATDELADYLSNIENKNIEEDVREDIYTESLVKEPLKKTGTTTFYERDSKVREQAFERAKGKCQLCGKDAPFIDKNGRPFLEIHHIIWLSNGGEDSIHNTVALCPNCHRKMHLLNDPKDIAYLKKLVR